MTVQLLADRRPGRADGARNFDAILEAAALAIRTEGPDVSVNAIGRVVRSWREETEEAATE